MTIAKFCVKVTKLEGKKKQVNIAQIKEVLSCTNKLLSGRLYRIIKGKL